MGEWNFDTQSYNYITYDNANFDIEAIRHFAEKWADHPSLYAIECINEPWGHSDIDFMKWYYRSVREAIREVDPSIKFVFYAVDGITDTWLDLFPEDDKENVVMDWHFYTAWWDTQSNIDAYCYNDGGYSSIFNAAKDYKYEVWIGEWSLATDVCAMWLGGFNDNSYPYKYECDWVECPHPYLPDEFAVDFDRTVAEQGPFGWNDLSTPKYGKCPTDSLHFSDEEITKLGQCIYDAFDANVGANFMWTFRNELEPKWSYPQAYDKGWIKPSPKDVKFLQS